MVDHSFWGLKLHCNKAFIIHEGMLFEFFDVEEAIQIHKSLMNMSTSETTLVNKEFEEVNHYLSLKKTKINTRRNILKKKQL